MEKQKEMEKEQEEILPPKIELTEEVKKKLEEIKNKLERFKTQVLKENPEIIGISLLPPPKLSQNASDKEKEEEKDKIDVFVLVNDTNVEKKFELKEKVLKSSDKVALSIDKNLYPQVMLTTELKEAAFDAKYELLQLISLSAPIYDSSDMLAAIKVAELHKTMVLRKFDKYIVSYVAAGSLFRGEKSNDIDTYIVIDDTDVKKMSRYELKERLRQMIITMGFEASDITGVKKSFHIQVYILTDFWESLKDAHPVIFTLLRDGVPLYDRGVFTPWKLLLQMGRIKPSDEAIDMQLDIGDKLLDNARKKMLGIVADNVYYAVLDPSQAAVMFYGLNPPTPKETLKLMEEIFVKKEKLLEPKYIKTLQKAIQTFKDFEHGKLQTYSGIELENFLKEAEEYIKRIKKLFIQIGSKHEKQSVQDIYNSCIKVVNDVLSSDNIKFTQTTLIKTFSEYCSKNNINEKAVFILKDIIKANEDYKAKKLLKAEHEKAKRESKTFIRIMVDYLQKKKSFELSKAKIRFKYGDKTGELIMLEKEAFLIDDINAKDKEISKATLTEDGSLLHIEKVKLVDFEDAIAKEKIPKEIMIKEKIFSQLKSRYGKNVELLVNY